MVYLDPAPMMIFQNKLSARIFREPLRQQAQDLDVSTRRLVTHLPDMARTLPPGSAEGHPWKESSIEPSKGIVGARKGRIELLEGSHRSNITTNICPTGAAPISDDTSSISQVRPVKRPRLPPRQRRPSESFFEYTSSEDEEEEENHKEALYDIERDVSSSRSMESPVEQATTSWIINSKARANLTSSADNNSPTLLGVKDVSSDSGSAPVPASKHKLPILEIPNGLSCHPTRRTVQSLPPRQGDDHSADFQLMNLVVKQADPVLPVRDVFVMTPYPRGPNLMESPTSDEITAAHALDEGSSRRENPLLVDRFPSIAPYETLAIEMGLAQHTGTLITVEINITDSATYDDEKLFRDLKSAYFKQLLGPTRWPLLAIRCVVFVEIDTPTALMPKSHAVEFLRHLSRPSLGHKRRTWISWFRTCTRALSSDTSIAQNCRWPDATEKTSRVTFSSNTPSSEQDRHAAIRVSIHYHFNFWVIGTLFFGTVWLSILASVLWITYGIPPTTITNITGYGAVGSIGSRNSLTQRDESAMLRTLTGLVLGLVVLVVGVLMEGCVMLGGWILL